MPDASAASEPHEVGEGCLDCPHPDYCAGMGKCEIGAAKLAARSAAQGHECDHNRALLPGTTKKPTDPQEQALLDRCTCDLARPYWHSFHREGCPLAR